MEEKVLVKRFICSRCGNKWLPRNEEEKPVQCPKCKSPYWDRPKKDPLKKNEGKK